MVPHLCVAKGKLLAWLCCSFIACNGLDFTKTISKDSTSDVCGRLQCYANNLPAGTRSILGIKVYDVTDGSVLLASVSGLPDCSADPATSLPMHLEVALKLGSHCDHGSFKCQLNYMNSEGEVDVEVSYIKPDQECNDPMRGWTLAFRGTARINQSVYDAYTTNQGNGQTVEPGCKQITSALPCTSHYGNNTILDNWSNVNQVAFIVYKNNTEVRRVVFDGRGTTNMNWFSQDRIETASWTDLKTETANVFSIDGWTYEKEFHHLRRRFFMNHAYDGCPGDFGWFVVLDKGTFSDCPWEDYPVYPVFKYSTGDRYTNWTIGNVDVADVFAVFVR
ncbi:unnamed protein product [Lymnaea stagnalis]|uniref:Uncharacterized protein n=1 Tax=Lymnaea stagnalis TaxID=6523 RepID=A0AAV2HP72_LYMST